MMRILAFPAVAVTLLSAASCEVPAKGVLGNLPVLNHPTGDLPKSRLPGNLRKL